jgi:hypothetical protein
MSSRWPPSQRGGCAAAEQWFRRALQLQPDFTWAHQDLLWLYTWQGELAQAAEQLRTTRALLPGSREFLDDAARLALVRQDGSIRVAVGATGIVAAKMAAPADARIARGGAGAARADAYGR